MVSVYISASKHPVLKYMCLIKMSKQTRHAYLRGFVPSDANFDVFGVLLMYRWGVKLKVTGLRLGFIGIICLNLLFLPISRGSVLLRAIDIPFEHATKYHVWLGHFMMVLFTLHGLFYSIAWYYEGRLIMKVWVHNSQLQGLGLCMEMCLHHVDTNYLFTFLHII